ncbi:MAG: hypothetical protein HUU20_06240 [Pirellulales bacterium]|nr:hypothetical protein [Pirellulales bacterium]
MSDGKILATMLVLRGPQDAFISPDGHYAAPPGLEKQLVYNVLTDAGEQQTLTPDEFSKQYGWRNDPSEALRILDVAIREAPETVGGQQSAADAKPRGGMTEEKAAKDRK